MKSLSLAMAILSGAIGSAFAGGPPTEFLCNAQCVYADTENETIDFGESVEGWSTYSMNEAYTDLKQHCQAPSVLVLDVAGSRHRVYDGTDDDTSLRTATASSSLSAVQRVSIGDISRHRISGVAIVQAVAGSQAASASEYEHRVIRIHTVDDFEYDLNFANAGNACVRSPVNPAAGRRYAGDHPIGG